MNDELAKEISDARAKLLARLDQAEDKASVLRAPELKALYERISSLNQAERGSFGKAVNELKAELSRLIQQQSGVTAELPPLDTTAPFAPNSSSKRPQLLEASYGSLNPITKEMERINEIFGDMGFSIIESRELDDDWHMFGSLNFPEGHPARDDYDTFQTKQQDAKGNPYLAPAHTSTMQNRVLKQYAYLLENTQPIAAILPGRVFRNEDVDARHEHTFYQFEGVYVGRDVTVGNLIATLRTFLESYYQTAIEVKTQPFYFPFTEPSLEFVIGCPFCAQKGCHICSHSGWIELLGCGMIHPEVLKEAGIDPTTYQGFAWGCGIDRLVMMKYNVEDIRLFESGRLEFLRQFSPGGKK